jgi:hypothetical protein
MLTVTIPAIEFYDEIKEEFITAKGAVLLLEHSLVSLSKWESKWCKPFLAKGDKTYEETCDYISCMTITQNVDPNVYKTIPNSVIEQVNEYIDRPMTATVIRQTHKGSREIITAEIIYYWMIALQIPFECQKWHLNRLLTLINVCNIKNGPQKKMSQRDVMRRNSDLNAARRKSLGSKG